MSIANTLTQLAGLGAQGASALSSLTSMAGSQTISQLTTEGMLALQQQAQIHEQQTAMRATQMKKENDTVLAMLKHEKDTNKQAVDLLN